MPEEKPEPQFKDTESLRRTLFICFGVMAVVNVAYLGSILSKSDAAIGSSALIYLGVYIVTAVFFLRWVFVANRNARALGASDMHHTPGWSVGWYFIPIAHLWKPYQAMKEIYLASNPDAAENWKEGKSPGFLPLWWAIWICGNIVGQISMRMTLHGADSTGVDMIGGVLDFALIAMGVVMVNTMYDWQNRKYRGNRIAASV